MRRAGLLLFLVLAGACGVKAAPRPPLRPDAVPASPPAVEPEKKP